MMEPVDHRTSSKSPATMDLAGRRVVVVGLGRAGAAAVRFLSGRAAQVVATDRRRAEDLADVIAGLPEGVTIELGEHRLATFVDADLVVTSPGVPPIWELNEAARHGVPVMDEAELASRFIEGTLLGVTGTNGKSTTTVLLGKLTETLGRPLFVGGNLGSALCDCLETEAAGPNGVVVAELSSFQLQRTQLLHPKVALFLNLSQDHLDRHVDMDEYVAAKKRIFANQNETDFAVLNADDPLCRAMAKDLRAQVAWFSVEFSVSPGGYLDGDVMHVVLPSQDEVCLDRSLLRIPGRHNMANALAALVAAGLLGVDLREVGPVLSAFSGLPHRMEHVGSFLGLDFYNDSKATNVGSAVGSLSGLEQRFVLIAGGRHKGGSYEALARVVADRARAVVLLGEAAPIMDEEFAGTVPLHRVETMDEAVALAASLAVFGDAVVLSPACSSYDMFVDYRARGQAFRDAVVALSGLEETNRDRRVP